jgi:DNA-binding PadR family transcriptional regulator
MRHMAAVPKGFLRYYVLRLLNEKPMSGSEIMSEIEKRTDGHWRPSPGSIYPLLAWLQEKGYSSEVPNQEPGVKRYTLTEQGKSFLEEHLKRKKELRNKIGFFAPPFVGPRWFNQYPKECHGLIDSGKKLVKSSWKLLDSLRQEHSEEAVAQATGILDDAAEKIEEIAKRLEGEKE